MTQRYSSAGLKQHYSGLLWSVCLLSSVIFSRASTTNLVSYYDFSNADNPSKNLVGTNHATNFNATWTPLGWPSGAYSFAGADQRLEAGYIPAYNFGSNNFTLSLWVYPYPYSSYSTHVWLDRWGSSSTNQSWALEQYRGKIRLIIKWVGAIGTASYYTPLQCLVAGQWQHIAVTRNASTLCMYHNGILVGTNAVENKTMQTNNAPLWIGNRQSNHNMHANGKLDKVKIFNRGFSSDDVALEMADGKGTFYYPDWWLNSGMVATNASSTNDFSTILAGQLKHVTSMAKDELDNNLIGTSGNPSGAGAAISGLVSGFSTTNNNYHVVNAGQLKNTARLFYDRFVESGQHSVVYPWAGATLGASDFDAANIGQMKYLFSFDPKNGFFGPRYRAAGDEAPDHAGRDLRAWNLLAAISPQAYQGDAGDTVLSYTFDPGDFVPEWDRFYLSRSVNLAQGWQSTGVVFRISSDNYGGTTTDIPTNDSLDITDIVSYNWEYGVSPVTVALEYTGGGWMALDGPVYLLRWNPGVVLHLENLKGADGRFYVACNEDRVGASVRTTNAPPNIKDASAPGWPNPHQYNLRAGLSGECDDNGGQFFLYKYLNYNTELSSDTYLIGPRWYDAWIARSDDFFIGGTRPSTNVNDCSLKVFRYNDQGEPPQALADKQITVFNCQIATTNHNYYRYPCDPDCGWEGRVYLDLQPHDQSVTGTLTVSSGDGTVTSTVPCGPQGGGTNSFWIQFSPGDYNELTASWTMAGQTDTDSVILAPLEHLNIAAWECDMNRRDFAEYTNLFANTSNNIYRIDEATFVAAGTDLRIADPLKYPPGEYDWDDKFCLTWTHPTGRIVSVYGSTNSPVYVPYPANPEVDSNWPLLVNVHMVGPGDQSNSVLTVSGLEISMTHSNTPICEDSVVLDCWIDADVDSGNILGYQVGLSTDSAGKTETNAPGKLIGAGYGDADSDGIPDFADGFDWSGLGGAYTNDNGSFVPLLLTVPSVINCADARLMIANYDLSDVTNVVCSDGVFIPAPGALRIWKKNKNELRTTNDLVYSGVYTNLYDLGSWTGNQQVLYLEGVNFSEPVDLSFSLGPNDMNKYCWSDKVTVTVFDIDLDADSDNTYSNIASPSYPDTPDSLSGEDQIEATSPVAVGFADPNGDGAYDYNTNSPLPDLGAVLDPRKAIMATLRLSFLGDGGANVGCRLYFDESKIVLWNGTDRVTSGLTVVKASTNLLAEGKEPGQSKVTARLCISTNGIDYVDVVDGSNGYLKDTVAVRVYKLPHTKAATDRFTPQQMETPPYHVAKVDYTVQRDGLDLGLWVVEDMYYWVVDWNSPIYRSASGNSPSPADTKAYRVNQPYSVTGAVERICWDGRFDVDADGVVDTNSAGRELFAPFSYVDLDLDEYGDLSLKTVAFALANKRPLAHLGLAQKMRTLPYGLYGSTGVDPLHLASAQHAGRFLEQVCSKTRSLSLSDNLLAVRNAAGPRFGFDAFLSGNSWRHTSMGFGFSNNFDLRFDQTRFRHAYWFMSGHHERDLVSWYGNRQLFDHGAGLPFADGMKLTPGDIRDGNDTIIARTLTTPDSTVYTFDLNGQLTNIQDRVSNTIEIVRSPYPGADDTVRTRYITEVRKKLAGTTVATMSFNYKAGSQNTQLESVSLNGAKTVSFSYTNEVLAEVKGLDFKETYGWSDGHRTNAVGRYVPGVITNRTIAPVVADPIQPTVKWHYSYDRLSRTSAWDSPLITSLGMGAGSAAWMNAAIDEDINKATYGDGTVEIHNYSEVYLQSIIKSGASGSAIFEFGFTSAGQRTTESTPEGNITYGYDPDGLLVSITRPGPYAPISMTYGNKGQLASRTVETTPARVTTYTLDGNGNATMITEGDKTWSSITYTPYGALDTITDPEGIVTDNAYNSKGMLIEVKRGGVPLQSFTPDPDTGDIIQITDAESNTTTYEYDGAGRVNKTTYANTDTEETKYTAHGYTVRHQAPKAGAAQPAVTTIAFDSDAKPVSEHVIGVGVNYITTYDTVDGFGRVTKASVDGLVQNYVYDYLGRRTETKIGDPGKSSGIVEYDQFGNVVRRKGGEGAEDNLYGFTYDAMNQIKTTTRPGTLGSVSYIRDGAGNIINQTDDAGDGTVLTTSWAYDIYDRPTNKTLAATDPVLSPARTWSYNYDKLDNIVSVKDPMTNETVYAPNRIYGAVTNITMPDGGQYTYVLNLNGDVTATINPLGKTWTTTRDGMRNFSGFTQPGTSGISASFDNNLYGQAQSGNIAGRDFLRTSDSLNRTTGLTPPGSSTPITQAWRAAGPDTLTTQGGLVVKDNYEAGSGLPDSTVLDPAGRNIVQDLSVNAEGQLTETEIVGTALTRATTREHAVDGSVKSVQKVASGVKRDVTRNGHGVTTGYSAPEIGSVSMAYDNMLQPVTLTVNGSRVNTYQRDLNGNVTLASLASGEAIEMQYDSANRLIDRKTTLSGGATREETFAYDLAGNVTNHNASGIDVSVAWDEAGNLLSITRQGATRAFTYDKGQVTSDTINGNGITRTYDGEGRILTESVGSDIFTFTYFPDGRLEEVLKNGVVANTLHYDSALFYTGMDDKNPLLGGYQSVAISPDEVGHARILTLPGGITQEQPVNDDDNLIGTILAGNTVNIGLQDGVIPVSVNRPGSAPDSSMTINDQKELTAITNSNGSGVNLTREAGSGRITEKAQLHLGTSGTSDEYTYYDNGWLASERRPGLEIAYNYREDGTRDNVVVNGEAINFIANAAGQIVRIENQRLGAKANSAYTVGVGGKYLTIEQALQALYAEQGTNAFTQEKTIWVVDNLYTNNIAISSAVAELSPTGQNRLIIRGRRGTPTRLTGKIRIEGLENVTLCGFEVSNTNALKGLVVEDALGTHIQSCVVLSDLLVTNSPLTILMGNTFNYTNGWGNIKAHSVGSIQFRNNIYLKHNDNPVIVTQGVTTAHGAYNLAWPSNNTGIAEVSCIYANPLLATNYSIASGLSPVIGTGTNIVGLIEDIRGKTRSSPPSRGAYEYGAWVGGVTENLTWVDGRLAVRNVNGKIFNFEYDGAGRLTAYTDESNPSNSATYEYDAFGRRILITVGGTHVTRCVYNGQDVVAEYIDEDGNGTVDRKRIYWLLPEIDQRVGFMDIIGGTTNVYYYLADQVGSVLQIVDSSGNVVNQYDYDAFGNVRWDSANTFVSVQNRYLFQGREWDAHAGHYYFRNRTYIPEWGSFTGPDMNLALGILGETSGLGSYLFCYNNPLIYSDPLGLDAYMFGGTWVNDVDPYSKYYVESNIAELRALYAGEVHYQTGVGTGKGKVDPIAGGAFGAGGQARLEAMYEDLVRAYNTPDNTGEKQQVDIYGFSRGAALARAFANMIYERGIPLDGGGHVQGKDAAIRFVGVFDTVGSFGWPGNDKNPGKKFDLPANVKLAAHAVSRHEVRGKFPVTLFASDPRVSQVYFAGVHSNLGGSYETGKAQGYVPLYWMWLQSTEAGVPIGNFPQDKYSAIMRYRMRHNLNWNQLWSEKPGDITVEPYHDSATGVLYFGDRVKRWFRGVFGGDYYKRQKYVH